jgi:hypothetical protein
LDDTAVDSGNISGGWSLTITAAAVPEPATWMLLAGGAIMLFVRQAGARFVRR